METVQQDTGLQCLALILRFHQVPADPAQIAHQFANRLFGVPEMLRCAKDLKLKARAVSVPWTGLARLPLPAIVQRSDGTFLIAGKVNADEILVQDPQAKTPQIIKR